MGVGDGRGTGAFRDSVGGPAPQVSGPVGSERLNDAPHHELEQEDCLSRHTFGSGSWALVSTLGSVLSNFLQMRKLFAFSSILKFPHFPPKPGAVNGCPNVVTNLGAERRLPLLLGGVVRTSSPAQRDWGPGETVFPRVSLGRRGTSVATGALLDRSQPAGVAGHPCPRW